MPQSEQGYLLATIDSRVGFTSYSSFIPDVLCHRHLVGKVYVLDRIQ